MNAIRSLLLLLVLVALTLALLLAGATGVGVLLNRLMPAVGLETGILIGAVALSVSLKFVLDLLGRAYSLGEEVDPAELEELVAAMHRASLRRRPRR